jgi:hypothetical protein
LGHVSNTISRVSVDTTCAWNDLNIIVCLSSWGADWVGVSDISRTDVFNGTVADVTIDHGSVVQVFFTVNCFMMMTSMTPLPHTDWNYFIHSTILAIIRVWDFKFLPSWYITTILPRTCGRISWYAFRMMAFLSRFFPSDFFIAIIGSSDIFPLLWCHALCHQRICNT